MEYLAYVAANIFIASGGGYSKVCFYPCNSTVVCKLSGFLGAFVKWRKPTIRVVIFDVHATVIVLVHWTKSRNCLLTLRRLMSYIYMEHPFLMFLDHTQRRSTVGRTLLDE